MNSYLAILKARILTLLQYRAAAFAGICTQIFWGIIYTMIFQAFYRGSGSAPISLEQAITFIWINQALIQLLPWNFDKEIQQQIRTGNVAYELIRPLDLYWLWFWRSLAHRMAPTVLRSIPLFILAGFFLGLSAPVSWTAGFLFIVSCLLGLWLASAITAIVVISMFWTVSGEGILRLMPSVTLLFSGLAVPLPLFPDWMQPFLSLQPLRGILDIPCRLYTGVIAASDAHYWLLFQFFWAIAFIIFGKWLMNRALRTLVIQGG